MFAPYWHCLRGILLREQQQLAHEVGGAGRARQRDQQAEQAGAEQNARQHAEIGKVGQDVRSSVLSYTRHEPVAASAVCGSARLRCDVRRIGSTLFPPTRDPLEARCRRCRKGCTCPGL